MLFGLAEGKLNSADLEHGNSQNLTWIKHGSFPP